MPPIQLSSANYELTLMVAHARKGEDFRELKNKLRPAFDKGRQGKQAEAKSILAHHGIKRRSLCPIAQERSLEELEHPVPPGFCEPIGAPLLRSRAGTVTCNQCPLSTDMFQDLDACVPIVTFGTYDFAVLWKTHSPSLGAFTKSAFRSLAKESELEFISIACNRIEDPIREPRGFGQEFAGRQADCQVGLAPGSRLCVFVFLEPAGWRKEAGAIERFVTRFLQKRSEKQGWRMEAFLTLSSRYPVFVKLEARNDDEARDALEALQSISDDAGYLVEESWTVYGVVASPREDALLDPPEPNVKPVEFLVLANVRNMGGRGFDALTQFQTTLRDLKATVTLTKPSPIVGYYDYAFHVTLPDSSSMADLAVKALRTAPDNGMVRCIALPLVGATPKEPRLLP